MEQVELARVLGRVEAKLERMHDDILEGKEARAGQAARIASLEHFRTWVKGGTALAITIVTVAAKARGLF